MNRLTNVPLRVGMWFVTVVATRHPPRALNTTSQAIGETAALAILVLLPTALLAVTCPSGGGYARSKSSGFHEPSNADCSGP
jgi:hypothetical protein